MVSRELDERYLLDCNVRSRSLGDVIGYEVTCCVKNKGQQVPHYLGLYNFLFESISWRTV